MLFGWRRTDSGQTGVLRPTSTVQLAKSAMLTRLHRTEWASSLSGQTDSTFLMNNLSLWKHWRSADVIALFGKLDTYAKTSPLIVSLQNDDCHWQGYSTNTKTIWPGRILINTNLQSINTVGYRLARMLSSIAFAALSFSHITVKFTVLYKALLQMDQSINVKYFVFNLLLNP